MCKKIIIVLICFISALYCFAGDWMTGVCCLYNPEDRKLFNCDNLQKPQNYKYGITAEYSENRFAFTEDIYFTNLESHHLKIEFSSSFSFRNNITDSAYLDCSMAIQSALEQAVEGSDRLYLTSNGVNIFNVPKLRKVHLLDLLGMFRIRFASGVKLNEKVVLRTDYSLSLYPFEEPILKSFSLKDAVGLGSLSVAILFKAK